MKHWSSYPRRVCLLALALATVLPIFADPAIAIVSEEELGSYTPYTSTVAPFEDMFELYVTQAVRDNWSSADFDTFMTNWVDADSTNSCAPGKAWERGKAHAVSWKPFGTTR